VSEWSLHTSRGCSQTAQADGVAVRSRLGSAGRPSHPRPPQRNRSKPR
jgi:hypothetical protein